MKVIENKTLDEERALYESENQYKEAILTVNTGHI